MVIDCVFHITGRGTVVTGRIRKGSIRLNDKLKLINGDKVIKTQCFFLEKFRKVITEAQAGEHVGIYLSGLNKSDIQKGITLTSDD